jgi:hypothetical protein
MLEVKLILRELRTSGRVGSGDLLGFFSEDVEVIDFNGIEGPF